MPTEPMTEADDDGPLFKDIATDFVEQALGLRAFGRGGETPRPCADRRDESD